MRIDGHSMPDFFLSFIGLWIKSKSKGCELLIPSSFCVAQHTACWSGLRLKFGSNHCQLLFPYYEIGWDGKYCQLEFVCIDEIDVLPG